MCINPPDFFSSNQEISLLQQLFNDRISTTDLKTILEDFNGLKNLAQYSPSLLERHPLLSKSRANRLYAALQLGKSQFRTAMPKTAITTPDLAYQLLSPYLQHQSEEQLFAIFLNRRRNLIALKSISKGSEAYTIVDPRQIFHYALVARSSGFILAHNHPSGDPSPSQQDLDITQRLQEIGKLLQLPLLDHLIIGESSFVSLASLGFCS